MEKMKILLIKISSISSFLNWEKNTLCYYPVSERVVDFFLGRLKITVYVYQILNEYSISSRNEKILIRLIKISSILSF